MEEAFSYHPAKLHPSSHSPCHSDLRPADLSMAGMDYRHHPFYLSLDQKAVAVAIVVDFGIVPIDDVQYGLSLTDPDPGLHR